MNGLVDVWFLSPYFDFSEPVLAEAISAALTTRHTPLTAAANLFVPGDRATLPSEEHADTGPPAQRGCVCTQGCADRAAITRLPCSPGMEGSVAAGEAENGELGL
jgi:hypothetical protein